MTYRITVECESSEEVRALFERRSSATQKTSVWVDCNQKSYVTNDTRTYLLVYAGGEMSVIRGEYLNEAIIKGEQPMKDVIRFCDVADIK